MLDMSSIEAARAEFPGTEELTYMNVSARGLTPQRSRNAVDAMMDKMQSGATDKAAMFDLIEQSRDGYAKLINATSDEISLVKNVSEGLNAIIAAYPWKSGDNVVLCQDLEHPNNVYPWRHLNRRLGVEVRSVSPRDGAIPTDEILSQINENTRMVTASSVTFAPGFRTDIGPIGAVCRERDILFLVDGVQSVGILNTDVETLNIDAMAVSTQKGLLGLYGMGFLYCRADWAERLTPVYLARFGVDLGGSGAHEASLGDDEYALMPAARRFDLGNYNYVGVAAADASISMMHELGRQRIVCRRHPMRHGPRRQRTKPTSRRAQCTSTGHVLLYIQIHEDWTIKISAHSNLIDSLDQALRMPRLNRFLIQKPEIQAGVEVVDDLAPGG